MTRKKICRLAAGALALVVLLLAGCWYGVLTTADSRQLGRELKRLHDLVEPGNVASAKTISARLKFLQASAFKGKLEGQEIAVRYRWPDRLTLQAEVDGSDYAVGRDGEEVWAWAAEKQFAVIGVNDVPRFASFPDSVQQVELADLSIPVKRWHLWLAPALLKVKHEDGWKITAMPGGQ